MSPFKMVAASFVFLVSVSAVASLDPSSMTCKQLRKTVKAAGATGVSMPIAFMHWEVVRHEKYGCSYDFQPAAAIVRTSDSLECDAGIYCTFESPNTGDTF